MVPIAFTSDHIETLYELDIEYGPEGKEVSQKLPHPYSHSRPPLCLSRIEADFSFSLRWGSSAWNEHHSSSLAERLPHVHSSSGGSGFEASEGVQCWIDWTYEHADGVEVPWVHEREV